MPLNLPGEPMCRGPTGGFEDPVSGGSASRTAAGQPTGARPATIRRVEWEVFMASFSAAVDGQLATWEQHLSGGPAREVQRRPPAGAPTRLLSPPAGKAGAGDDVGRGASSWLRGLVGVGLQSEERRVRSRRHGLRVDRRRSAVHPRPGAVVEVLPGALRDDLALHEPSPPLPRLPYLWSAVQPLAPSTPSDWPGYIPPGHRRTTARTGGPVTAKLGIRCRTGRANFAVVREGQAGTRQSGGGP
jgi:hypothetical protein